MTLGLKSFEKKAFHLNSTLLNFFLSFKYFVPELVCTAINIHQRRFRLVLAHDDRFAKGKSHLKVGLVKGLALGFQAGY